jgi:hypothetical protein
MFGIDQSPLSFVVAVRSAPVALLIRCTVAPGTLAPVVSVTFPTASELELAWPYAIGENTAVAKIGRTPSANARHVPRITRFPVPSKFVVAAEPEPACISHRAELPVIFVIMVLKPPKLPARRGAGL